MSKLHICMFRTDCNLGLQIVCSNPFVASNNTHFWMMLGTCPRHEEYKSLHVLSYPSSFGLMSIPRYAQEMNLQTRCLGRKPYTIYPSLQIF